MDNAVLVTLAEAEKLGLIYCECGCLLSSHFEKHPDKICAFCKKCKGYNQKGKVA